MNKVEFLTELRKGLLGLPENDIEDRVAFYSEMIDDCIEEGLSEEDAVMKIGSVQDVVRQTLSETPLTKIVKEKVKPKRNIKAWEIILIILGAPLWIPLLITVFALMLAIYIIVWSLIVALWSVEVSLVACFVAGLISSPVFFFRGFEITALFMIGFSLISMGLSLLFFCGCKEATQALLFLTKKTAVGIKTLFVGKE